MSQISDFEKEYREQLAKAVAEEDMPPELLEEYDFENCILKTAKKEVYLLRRKTDGVQGLLRISISYPEEDALEEAKLLERLSSPAIPRVYATYKQGDRNYLLREYFPGSSLYDIVRDGGTLPASEIYAIAEKLCDVFDYFHNQDPPIIHRDIKPQNIIMTPEGGIKLIDFGIARLHKRGQEQDTSIILTGAYAPPEQFGYDQTSTVTDIYSLGMVMLYMATGEIDKRNLDSKITDRKLCRLIKKCIAFDPNARFQSAQQVKKHIDQIKTGRNTKIAMVLTLSAVVAFSASFYTYYINKEPVGEHTSLSNISEPIDDETVSGDSSANIPESSTNTLEPSINTPEPSSNTPELSAMRYTANISGNMNNDGLAVWGSNEIFYICNNQIWRMEPDGTNRQPLTTIRGVKYLNYWDGSLFCSSPMGIHKIDLENEEDTLIVNVAADALWVYNNQLYFENREDEFRLYRANIDGTGMEKVSDLTKCHYLNFTGEYVYFCHQDNDRQLYRIKLDGSELNLIYNRESEWISICGDRIYISDQKKHGVLCP